MADDSTIDVPEIYAVATSSGRVLWSTVQLTYKEAARQAIHFGDCRHAIDALADQWPAVVAEWWERERMVTT